MYASPATLSIIVIFVVVGHYSKGNDWNKNK